MDDLQKLQRALQDKKKFVKNLHPQEGAKEGPPLPYEKIVERLLEMNVIGKGWANIAEESLNNTHLHIIDLQREENITKYNEGLCLLFQAFATTG
ncbi:hypothetical protein BGZ80_006328, partial [Entomortierella chlamydospora]